MTIHSASYATAIDSDCMHAWDNLPYNLFNKDVILVGGSYAGDVHKFTPEEIEKGFFVQLNHHIHRRYFNQPCDWLIARQGSGMVLGTFLNLPEANRNRIKVISAQVNEKEKYMDWFDHCVENDKILFPFHEAGFAQMNPYHPALEWCNQFWNEIGTNPFIGILAIKMILMFPVKSLRLVGFDFFRHPHGGFSPKISCHHVKSQVLWLLNIYNTDFRLTVTPDIEDAFNSFGTISRGRKSTFDMDK